MTESPQPNGIHLFYGRSNVLSAFYRCEFSDVGGTFKYNSVQQYVNSIKAFKFRDVETFKKIMQSTDPAECQRLGRQVKGFRADIWDGMRDQFMLNANFLKFSQNPKLRHHLLSTGDKVLAEASPTDRHWGIGHASYDPFAVRPHFWRGKNMLGRILGQIRDELRKEGKDSEVVAH